MAAKKRAAKKKAAKPKKKVLTATRAIKQAAAKSATRAAKGAKIKKVAGYDVRKSAKPDKLVLYGLQQSIPTGKVALMLALLGVPYDYKHVDLRAGVHKTPAFAKINRFQQVPALIDGEEAIVQSSVILQYLAEKFGKFGGKTPAERRRVAEWLAWDLDKLTGLGGMRFIRKFLNQPEHPALGWLDPRARGALEYLDRHLGTSKHVAGPFPTIADVSIFAWIAVAEEAGFDPANFPNIRDWARRMMTLRGIAHPYALLPTEDRNAT